MKAWNEKCIYQFNFFITVINWNLTSIWQLLCAKNQDKTCGHSIPSVWPWGEICCDPWFDSLSQTFPRRFTYKQERFTLTHMMEFSGHHHTKLTSHSKPTVLQTCLCVNHSSKSKTLMKVKLCGKCGPWGSQASVQTFPRLQFCEQAESSGRVFTNALKFLLPQVYVIFLEIMTFGKYPPSPFFMALKEEVQIIRETPEEYTSFLPGVI